MVLDSIFLGEHAYLVTDGRELRGPQLLEVLFDVLVWQVTAQKHAVGQAIWARQIG